MKRFLFLIFALFVLVSCGEEETNVGSGVYSGKITQPINIKGQTGKIVEITLDGADISCGGVALISAVDAEKLIITLADGSENTLSVTSAFSADDKANAAIYAKCDVVFKGSGALTINNPYGHGIEAKDDLTFEGGSYNITSLEHGVNANDSISVKDGAFVINSQKDGFHAENEEDLKKGYIVIDKGTFDITSALDGISAAAYMTLGDGSFNITAGGGVTESVSRDFDLAQMPEGMERPSREHMAQMPEGTERPSRGDMPQMPEGAELPDIENMPQRGQMGDKGQWGMKPDRQWGNESTSDTSTESMKGIKAGGVLTVNGGVYSISSADDCLHSNTDLKVLGGEFTLSSDDDAFHADSNLLFADGNVNVITSYEALEGESIDIKGGSFTLVSSDDGLNAAGGADQSGFGKRGDMFGSTNSYINISGGNITLNANGDGIDSNGSLTVSGGDILVLGPLSGGDAPVDWQMSGEITGGTVIAVGNSSMAMNFTKATQCSVFIALDSYVESGKSFQLMDSDGNVVLEKIVDKRYNCILVSTPDMKENGSYTLVTEAAEHPFTLDGYTYSNKIGGFGGGFGGRGQKNIA